MSFTAEFLGGPLDGVRSLITNPALPVTPIWGVRCLGSCQLARLVDAELRPVARQECREQRCHTFAANPGAFGLPGARRYRRTGAKANVHQYEAADENLAPGAAIYREPAGAVR